MVTTSASSGAMLMVNGWSVLNLLSLPIVLVALCSTLWLATRTGWGLGRIVPKAA